MVRVRAHGARRVIRIYQPWPAPVRAACYRDPSALPEIEGWVASLREQGLVRPDVEFTVATRRGGLVGVLRDRAGEHELAPSGYLVFGQCGLRVFDERSFFQRYHDPQEPAD